jgi:hypothetical protein
MKIRTRVFWLLLGATKEALKNMPQFKYET